jgi:molybdopterin-binding protein
MFVTFSVSGLAQGVLSGVVTDETEANIPGVEVTAVNTATGVENMVLTNGSGAFSIPQLSTPAT